MKSNALAQLKVLYVEDDKETRQELGSFLRRRTGKLLTAEDGSKALEIFKEEKPDIVIADLLMPNMHGIDMLRQMRNIDSSCRFLITSSVNETDVMLQAIDLGIVKYAVKPISLVEFDNTLHKLADDIYTSDSSLLLEIETKKEFEKEIKKRIALYMKNVSGKGPRDVSVFIHDSLIELVSYDVLTPMEQKLMTSSSNYSVVEQSRRYFYTTARPELEAELSNVLGRKTSLNSIEIHPDRAMDKITFSIEQPKTL